MVTTTIPVAASFVGVVVVHENLRHYCVSCTSIITGIHSFV